MNGTQDFMTTQNSESETAPAVDLHRVDSWLWKLYAANCAMSLVAVGLDVLSRSWKMLIFQAVWTALMGWAAYTVRKPATDGTSLQSRAEGAR